MRKRKRWDKCGTLFAWRGQEVVAEHCDVPDRHASESPGPHLPLLSAEERSSCFPQLCTFIAFLRRPRTHIFLVLPSHSQYPHRCELSSLPGHVPRIGVCWLGSRRDFKTMGKTLEGFFVDCVMHSFSALGDPRIMYTINISTGVSAQIPLDMKYSLMGATVSKECVVAIIHTSTSRLGALSRH